MVSGGTPREYAAALGGTMGDPTAGHRSFNSPDQALRMRQAKVGWLGWLLIAAILAAVALLYFLL